MPALPDDVASVFSRYTRLAELCRESAAKARLATVARSLRKLAANYDRRASEEVEARAGPESATGRRSNRVPPMAKPKAEAEARPMFRFADPKRHAGLGIQKSEHGSD